MGNFILYAAIVTKGVDMVRTALDPTAEKYPKVTWIVMAFVLGIVIATSYQLQFGGVIEGLPPGLARLTGVSGQVFSGLLLGAWASGLHELFDLGSGAAKALHAKAAGVLKAR